MAPYELGAKEGIALINGAPLAPALAVPLALRAGALLEHATLCGAMAIALTGAPARPYVARVGELKGDPGQRAVHRRLGNLLEKRLHRLLDARFSRLPDQLTPDPGRQSGVVILHKQVIGIAAQARTLAAPPGIHVLDGSTGQEDFETHTLLAAQQLDGVLSALELALAHELVALRQARHLTDAPLPAPLEDALVLVADVVPPVLQDRSLAGDVEQARVLVTSGRLIGGVRSPGIWSSRTPG